MAKTKLLFVTHDASRTGAPFLLLHLLRWMRQNAQFDFEVLFDKGGPLESEFGDLAPVMNLENWEGSVLGRGVARLPAYRLQRLFGQAALRRLLGRRKFDLVYSNTLVNGKLLAALPEQRAPLISHAHELEHAIQRNTPVWDFAYTLRRTNHFIAGSAAVARNLIATHGVEVSRIDVVHEFIPALHNHAMFKNESSRAIRRELGIPDGAFVAGAAGSVEWRKGYDLFMQVAVALCKSKSTAELHFVWVGGAWDRRIPGEIDYDLRKLGLADRVHFVGSQRNYLDYLDLMDALCLTSREDPFPLVVLEAASLGKPIICFDGAGGAPEFVEDDCGFVVPYLDAPAMASRLGTLIDNRDLLRTMGHRAKTKVQQNHDVAVIAPKIVEIIERTIAASRKTRSAGS